MQQGLPTKKKKGGKQPGAGRPQKFKKELCVGVSISVPVSKAVYVKNLIKELCEKWSKEEEQEQQNAA